MKRLTRRMSRLDDDDGEDGDDDEASAGAGSWFKSNLPSRH